MNKKNYLLTLLLLGVNIFSQTKEEFSSATYVVSNTFSASKEDVLAKVGEKVPEIKDKDNKPSLDKVFDILSSKKAFEVKVFFNDNYTYYTPPKMVVTKLSEMNMLEALLTKRGSFFTFLKNNKSINYLELGGKKFEVEYLTSNRKWVITEEKKQIGKYLCTKALSKNWSYDRNGKIEEKPVIAWFAEGITPNIAPMYYFGLPGIIVDLILPGSFQEFKLSDIDTTNKTMLEIKKDSSNLLSEEQMKKTTYEYFQKNP